MTQSTVEYPKKGVVDAVKEAPVRVLHVDDEADFLKAAKQILEMQGAFQVETATSVEKAMEKIKEKSFDVVVSDYVMPGKNGLDFLKELRDCGNDIPFIMFTGKGREEVAIKALNLGADCYFNKIGGPETVYGELAHGIRQAVESRRAENALLESEEKFRNLAEQSPNMIFVNLKGRVVYANKKCEEKMGYTKEEFYSPDFNFLTLIAPEYSDLLKSSFSRHMKGEEVLPLEYALLTKEGKRIDAILTTKLIRYEGETAILGTVTDITERKKMEAALRKSEEKYRCLVQDTDTGIISVDIEGKFTFVNKAVCEMIGYSEKELLGKPFIGFIHPGDRDRILQLFLDFMQNPESRPSFEFRVVHKEGHLVHLCSSPTIFKYQNKIIGSHAIIIDVTERKKAEKELKESEERYRTLFETIKDGIAALDVDGHIVECNQAYADMLGYSKDELKKMTLQQLTPKKWHQISTEKVEQLWERGYSDEYKKEYIRKDGTVFQVSIRGWLIRDENGKPKGIWGIIRDNTERKKAEKELLESEEKYRSIVELAPDGIITIDLKGKVTSCNTAILKQSGYSKDEIVGKHFTRLPTTRVRDIPKFLRVFKDIVRGVQPKPLEFKWVHKDGTTHLAEIHIGLLKERDKTVGFQAILRDTMERKKTEDALRRSENKYRTLLENLPQKIFFKDKNSVYISCNENYARDLKIKPDEIAGKTDYDFYPKKLAEKYRADDGRLMESGKTEDIEEEYIQDGQKVFVHTVKTPVRDENGDVVGILGIFWNITEQKKMEQELQDAREKWVSLTENTDDVIMILDGKGTIQYLNPTLLTTDPREVIGKSVYEYVPREQHDIMRESLRKVFKTGKPDSYEISPNIQGIGTIWFNTKVVPIKHDKKTVSVILISTDITKRKQAEESLKATLEKVQILNEKLGVVGKLARHDARNKLSTVTMNAFLMKQKTAYDPETLKHLSEIETACGEIERIFDFARIYEKIGVEELAYMNVEKTLAEAVMLFSDMQGIKVVNDCRGLTVLADSLLRQLFYNLTDNSLKHGENVSQIRVYYEEVGKNRLKLVYEDDGTGIPKDEKEKIFTEGYGKDTGYGLYLIRKMCEVYGWTIKEAGKQGKGAKFTMAMPKTGKSGKDNYRFLKN